MRFYLASASPRRAELLKQVGIDHEVIIPDVEEKIDQDLPPGQLAVLLASLKARAVADRLNKGLVLAADTLVIHNNKAIGKPRDRAEAREMLQFLSGDHHLVITGLCIINLDEGREASSFSETKVWMKKLAAETIDCYVESDEPLDKAGAYGIQGRAALFIEKIEGCYFNVVGLPLSLLDDLLKQTHYKL